MTHEQAIVSAIVKTIFRLNGQALSGAEALARPAGLTAAWWQVLGTVVREPLSVADVARRIGVTRQSVQRIADTLVAHGLAEYRFNPAHRRAKLLALTPDGRARIRRLVPGHAVFARDLAALIDIETLEHTLASLQRLSEALETLERRRTAHATS